jgi:dimethylargininase
VNAIVRPPAPTFANGITSADLGPPDEALALRQHAAYVDALERCGVDVVTLELEPAYPDSTFVEDTAVALPGAVILTRPGAPSRRGEVESVRRALEQRGSRVRAIESPGTLDGGDVCEAGNHYFIGLSARTNEAGAQQLTDLLAEAGCTSSRVDIRGRSILHLKSAIASVGKDRLVVSDDLRDHEAFREYERIRVPPGEEYAANCVLVNGSVFVAAGFPKLARSLSDLGYSLVTLEMSEFQKMDGGLSCLSLRF